MLLSFSPYRFFPLVASLSWSSTSIPTPEHRGEEVTHKWGERGGGSRREETQLVQDNCRKIGVCSHRWPASHSPPSAAHSLGWQPAPCRSCWPLSLPGWRGRGEKQCEMEKWISVMLPLSRLYCTLQFMCIWCTVWSLKIKWYIWFIHTKTITGCTGLSQMSHFCGWGNRSATMLQASENRNSLGSDAISLLLPGLVCVVLWNVAKFNNLMSYFQQEGLQWWLTRTHHLVPVVRCRTGAPSSLHHWLFIEQPCILVCYFSLSTYIERPREQRVRFPWE